MEERLGKYITEGTILMRKERPQIEIHTVTVKDCLTLDSRIVKKNSGTSSSVEQNVDGKEETAAAPPPTSSQAYKKYMEEMEFKIRYIKNDIEFKRDQMKKRKITDVAPCNKNQNQTSLQQSRTPVSNNRKIIAPSNSKDTTGSLGNAVQVCHVKSIPYRTDSQPLPHMPVVQKSALERLKPPLLPTETKVVYKKKEYTSDSPPSETEKHSSDNKPPAHSQCHRLGSTSFPAQHINVRAVIAPRQSLESSQHPTTLPHRGLPKNVRTVIIPSKKAKATQSTHEPNIEKPEPSVRRVVAKIKPVSLRATQPSSCPGALLSSSSMISTSQMSSSKYKYVAKKSMGPDSIKSSTPSVAPLTSLSSIQSSPPVVQSRMVFKRQTSGESRRLKKITPLKTNMVAKKLVSKYKLKRLSPTSASKTAPQFCAPSTSFLGSQRKTQHPFALPSSRAARVNLFKLDKRKVKADISAPKLRDQNHNYYRKSKSRFSLKYVSPSISKLGFRQDGSSSHMSGLHRAGKQKWASIDVRHQPVKAKLAAKRYAALAPFRWKSSKPNASDANVSQFKWPQSQDSQYKRKLLHVQSQKPAVRYHSKTFTNVPYVSRHSQRTAKLIMIGGVVYRSSLRCLKRAGQVNKGKEGRLISHQLTNETKKSVTLRNSKPHNVKLIRLRGVRYHTDARGKKLCRVSGSGSEKGAFTTNTKHIRLGIEKVRDIHKKIAASRALQRSLAYVAAKHKKDNRLKKGKPRNCMFFCRFGKCHRGDACPYVHDINKVVVCTRFLRGKCDGVGCLFSHDASVHKMPVCLFYLQGLCAREDCLYLHVNVSQDAPPCKDFLQGYCALGEKCKKLHSFLCPSYAVFGKCSKGDACSLLHRQSKKSQTVSPSSVSRPVSSPASSHESVVRRNDKADDGSSTPTAQNTNSSVTSAPEADGSDGLSQFVKSSPLKSQPAFISLSSITPVDPPTSCSGESNVVFSKEKKTKIKPEFKLLDAEASTNHMEESPRGSPTPTSTAPSPISVSPVAVADESKRTVVREDYSGFINLSSPSVGSDFLNGETSGRSSEGESVESPRPHSEGVEQNQDLSPLEDGVKSRALACKAVLLNKGIIPNFLPPSLPGRNSPGSV